MKVTITPGPCKMITTVDVEKKDRKTAIVKIQTNCGFYKPIEEELSEVDVNSEIFGKLGEGVVYTTCKKYCKHATCPVPCGILKAIEATFQLALPTDVTIEFEK